MGTNLSEIIKFVLVFLFSFSIYCSGLWSVNKNKKGFSVFLVGCGISSVFISILLSYFYFRVITNQLVLSGLLLGWSVINLLLSKKFRLDIVVIISYIGLFIGLLLGAFGGLLIIVEPICTVGVVLILHSIFVFLVGIAKIKTSDKLYSVFPFIFIFGNLFLIFSFIAYMPLLDTLYINNFSIIFLTFSLLLQVFSYLVYMKRFCILEKNPILIGAVLVLSFLICMLGFSLIGSEYNEYGGSITLFESLIETPYYPNDIPTADYVQKIPRLPYFSVLSLVLSFIYVSFVSKLNGRYFSLRNTLLMGLFVCISVIFSLSGFFTVLNSLFGTLLLAIPLLLYSHYKNDRYILNMSLISSIIGVYSVTTNMHTHFLEYNLWIYCLFIILHLIYFISASLVLKKNNFLSCKILYHLIGIFNLILITYPILSFILV